MVVQWKEKRINAKNALESFQKTLESPQTPDPVLKIMSPALLIKPVGCYFIWNDPSCPLLLAFVCPGTKSSFGHVQNMLHKHPLLPYPATQRLWKRYRSSLGISWLSSSISPMKVFKILLGADWRFCSRVLAHPIPSVHSTPLGLLKDDLTAHLTNKTDLIWSYFVKSTVARMESGLIGCCLQR